MNKSTHPASGGCNALLHVHNDAARSSIWTRVNAQCILPRIAVLTDHLFTGQPNCNKVALQYQQDASLFSFDKLAVGQHHACALVRMSGEMRCWHEDSVNARFHVLG